MSEKEVEQLEMNLEEQLDTLASQLRALRETAGSFGRMVPLIWSLLAGAVGFGGWLATIEYRQSMSDVANEHQDLKIETLSHWKERTDAKLFTAPEAAAVVSGIKDTLSNLDKRQQRTEDAMETVKDTLERIESRLAPASN